ncbi:MAG: hypothetical protein GY862_36525 [Gammaproteobacteria bacterium]|nr:hypothetical protein [Gammaproteobacteria bacterium]
MRQAYKVILQILFICFFIEQAQGEYLHSPTGTVFPDKIGVMKNVKVTDYEKDYPGLGVGISYRGHGVKADVYLYNDGLKEVPGNIESLVMIRHFEQVIGSIYAAEEKGPYRSIRKRSGGTVSLGKHLALFVSFTYIEDDIERISHIYLMGYENHFVKIRFTYHKASKSAGEKSLKLFLQEMGKVLAKNKQGELLSQGAGKLPSRRYLRSNDKDYSSVRKPYNIIFNKLIIL